ncbi:MAG: chorismate synthase [Hornefia butyriciproducens]|uniref:chorismate synthase n=1 Tax=Hornefia butyriciproducens TaxID=2652293 RepID=UPI002A74FDFC|nr:chorismate synthase [Hornefia butyriciproducens]MCI7327324.1 chorismate synthase [Clostridiales bacterium]MDY2991680.1 chorismate synthase [Hornefia butyriciproducens]
MASEFGKNIRVSIFGESHGAAIGVSIDGMPAGVSVDMERLQHFLDRRAPGRSRFTTARREEDRPEFLCGIRGGVTCGTPITAIIRNRDTRSGDYSQMESIPRPGHADYAARMRYGGNEDCRGGGHFSGRLTAPLCVAGGIFLQALEAEGITVRARILEIGGNTEDPRGEIEKAMAEKDSVGGIIECVVNGMPPGIGDPIYDGLENRISLAVFGIPAVKGIEFGRGFEVARLRGSENNDAFYFDGGTVKTRTNNHGGILGGISSGMPIVFRVAVKPTPSIGKEQDSIRYDTGENVKMTVQGRHDPCIVPRAVPCVEAAAAMAIYDLMAGEIRPEREYRMEDRNNE